jgi:hypothetical protein
MTVDNAFQVVPGQGGFFAMQAGPSESFYSSVIPVAVLIVVLVLWRAAIRRGQQQRWWAAQHPRATVQSVTAGPAAVASQPHPAPPLVR